MIWKMNPERLQKAVERLLSLAQFGEPPVPIEQIAERRGVLVRCVPYKGPLSGLLIWEGGQPVIGINALHEKRQQRFAIAHELAHIELRHHTGIHIDRAFPFPLASQKTSPKIAPVEFEASIVACELLIPAPLLAVDLQEELIDYLDEAFVYSLARRYEVSAHTMLLRLTHTHIFPRA